MEPSANLPASEELLAQAGWIRALARRLVQDAAEAEDLAHETILAALKRKPHTDRSLRPWLAQVMRTTRAWRRRGRESRKARERAVAREEALPSSAELASRAEQQRRLVEEVLRLSDPYRSLLLLRYYEGLTPQEIAVRRQVPSGTVRGQLSRGLALLRERFDRDSEESGSDWRVAFLPLFSAGEPAVAASAVALAPLGVTAKLLLFLTAIAAGVFWFRPWAVEDAGPEAVPPPSTLVQVVGSSGAAGDPALAAAGPRAAAGRTPAPLAGAPSDIAVISGRLGFAGTSEPVQQYLLELVRDGKLLESLVTDEEGRFQTSEPHPAGGYELRLVDHPEQGRKLWFGGSCISTQSPRSVDLEWAPTTDIGLDVAPLLQLPLRLWGPTEVVAELTEVELSRRRRPELFVSIRTPLRRRAEGHWVRFAPLETPLLAADEWFLHVESADGLWAADARLPALVRRPGEPVELRLAEAARLVVCVPWQGERDYADLRAAIRVDTSGGKRELVPLEERAGETCLARGGLPPGTWDLMVRAEGIDTLTRPVILEAGRTTRVTVPLEIPSELADLDLVVRSASGTYHGILAFDARTADGQVFAGSRVEWEQTGGVWVGRQKLEALPVGEYELHLSLSLDPVRWSGLPLSVSVPGDAPELLGEDGGRKRDLGLRVREVGTSRTPKGLELVLSLDGNPGYHARARGELLVWRGVPVAADARWALRAPGYEAATGDWSRAELEGSTSVVRVELQSTR